MQHPRQADQAFGPPPGTAGFRSGPVIASIYGQYTGDENLQLNPADNEMIKIGLWLELEVGLGFMVGLGLGSLIGQRTVPIVLLVVLQIIVTPLLAVHVIPYFLDGQRLVVGIAMDQLRPAGLAGGGGGGPGHVLFGGRGALEIPPMPTWAMISVIVADRRLVGDRSVADDDPRRVIPIWSSRIREPMKVRLRQAGVSPRPGRWAVAVQDLRFVGVPGGGGAVRVQDQGPAPPMDDNLVVEPAQ